MSLTADLLGRVWRAYQSCRTYEDSGEVVTISHSAHGKRGRRLPFQTAFIRPDRFRYEFHDQENDLSDRKVYVVWSGGGVTRSWWSLRPGIQTFDSVLNALAGPTGVSGGSAYDVPPLLMGSTLEQTWLVREFGDAEEEGREEVDGIECVRIRCVNRDPTFIERQVPVPSEEMAKVMHRSGQQPPRSFKVRWEWRALWISSGDMSIRKMEDRTSFDSHISERTTTWRPRMNEAVDEDRFRFDPPA